MKPLIVLFCLLTIYSCSPQTGNKLSSKTNQFQNKYEAYIPAEETVVESWYHYVTTIKEDGSYVRRVFFPQTKQITSEVTYADKQLKVKDGLVTFWHENGHLKSEGNTKNDNKEGEWKHYHRQTGKLSSQGQYHLDNETGLWKTYDKEGRLSREYVYKAGVREGKFAAYDTLGTVLSHGTYKADTIFDITVLVEPDIDPNFKVVEEMPYLSQCKSEQDKASRHSCSTQALLQYIYKNLRYPATAREYGLEGMTLSQFTVSKDGKVKDLDVYVGLCQEFKDECLRVLSNMPAWESGMQAGKKVDVLYTLPIKFKLQ